MKTIIQALFWILVGAGALGVVHAFNSSEGIDTDWLLYSAYVEGAAIGFGVINWFMERIEEIIEKL